MPVNSFISLAKSLTTVNMSDQAPASASAETTTTTTGPHRGREATQVQCKNPKEAIEYELKAMAIVMDVLKHLQRGTDPVPGDIDLDSVYPQMVHDLKKVVSISVQPCVQGKQKRDHKDHDEP